RDLPAQAAAALGERPDLVVVLVGANDATHAARLSGVRRDLGSAVRSLTAAGVPVVVATAPDLGAARSFDQPLRTVLAWEGRRVAAAEAGAVTRAGGLVVPLGRLTGPTFRADPSTLSRDRFHPSDHGYDVWATAIEPVVLRAARPR
ncbi:MAG: GDSL-type esterase/lipase family protein, partial [Actinomycetota bacterium]|nr:GDSL-type esterase/lipase family protein [Actinomycetota bacterium]